MERRKYRSADRTSRAGRAGRNGRKVWTILLAVLLVLTMMPAAAFAQGEGALTFTYTGDPVIWNYDGSATITVPYTPTGEGDVTVERVEPDGTTTEMPATYNEGENEGEGTVTWTTNTHSFYMIQTKASSGSGSGSGSGIGSIDWPPATQQPADPETPETPEIPETSELTKSDLQTALDGQALVARSRLVTMKNGKKAIKVTWYDENGETMDFDGVEIFRSTRRSSGYGKKPFFETKKDVYYNTAIQAGTRYYYRVRGYVEYEGEKLYTSYSKKAWRTVL